MTNIYYPHPEIEECIECYIQEGKVYATIWLLHKNGSKEFITISHSFIDSNKSNAENYKDAVKNLLKRLKEEDTSYTVFSNKSMNISGIDYTKDDWMEKCSELFDEHYTVYNWKLFNDYKTYETTHGLSISSSFKYHFTMIPNGVMAKRDYDVDYEDLDVFNI